MTSNEDPTPAVLRGGLTTPTRFDDALSAMHAPTCAPTALDGTADAQGGEPAAWLRAMMPRQLPSREEVRR